MPVLDTGQASATSRWSRTASTSRPDGWRVRWHEQTICAACGEACKRGGLPAEGEVVYVGDGISDRCAAQAADRVFATRGLARYFDERNLPYEPFDDFHDIVRALTG